MNGPTLAAAVLAAATLTVAGALPSAAQPPDLMESPEISVLRAAAPEEFEIWRVAILKETRAMAALSLTAPTQFEAWEAAEAWLRTVAPFQFEAWAGAETRLRVVTRPVPNWYFFGGPAEFVDGDTWGMARTEEMLAMGVLQQAAPIQFERWAAAQAQLRAATPEAFEAWEMLRMEEAAAADQLRVAAPDARAGEDLFSGSGGGNHGNRPDRGGPCRRHRSDPGNSGGGGGLRPACGSGPDQR